MTARERAVAEKIMKEPNVEVQVGKHMDCHNRFKSKAWRALEEKIEHARAKLEALKMSNIYLKIHGTSRGKRGMKLF